MVCYSHNWIIYAYFLAIRKKIILVWLMGIIILIWWIYCKLHSLISQDILKWQSSREFFYWHLKRRLLERQLKKKMKPFTHNVGEGELNSMLHRWFVEDKGTVKVNKLRCTVYWFWSQMLHYIASVQLSSRAASQQRVYLWNEFKSYMYPSRICITWVKAVYAS